MAALLRRGAAGLLSRLQTCAPTVQTLSSSKSFSQNIPSCLWKLGRLNHVAIAVPDLEKAQSLYKDVLGAQVSETVALPEHGVYTVFVELGNTKLELLHPLGEKSPIASFLQKNKTGGMHHICIELFSLGNLMNLNLGEGGYINLKGTFTFCLLPSLFHHLMNQCSVITYKGRYFSLLIES
ncbi:methylmalonyl-CoA epimerase, mitochondrial isoform X1 [Molothrus ater]|uniref:methylmalonyl-CoA epimerase, mitochondrial isoform X1 n=1 Tax=Molothrus ater TaxID=84834 RepID=UPI00174CD4DB|nr:methylmalonyl-CoA epimerase, mitochondrial isoform X1 [Molothrus ater]